MNFYLVSAHGNLDILTADQLMPDRKSDFADSYSKQHNIIMGIGVLTYSKDLFTDLMFFT